MAEIQHPAAREEQAHLSQTKTIITTLQGIGQEELANAAAELKEARSLGDLSENADYDAARDRQAQVESRITQLEEMLKHIELIDTKKKTRSKNVQIGMTVTLRFLDTGREETYTIVGSTEADPLNGKLSNVSLVGQHLLGLKAGDKVEFPVPDGMARYKVVEVKR